MQIGNWFGFLLLGTIPIILFFYFYKNKSKTEIVPSLFIWNKIFQSENSENKSFKKLLKNLLLILEILICILTAFAVSKPYFNIGKISDNIVLIMDCGYNMMAKNGEVFETAKKEAKEIVKQANNNAVVTVIKANGNSVVCENQDKNSALDFIDDLETDYSTADFDNAISLAKNIMTDNSDIYLFSDYGVQIDDVEDTKSIHNFAVSDENDNTAIVSLYSDRVGDSLNVKSEIRNYSDKKQKRTIMLYSNDVLVDYKEVEVQPKSQEIVSFQNVPNSNLIFARTKESESLKVDDIRYLTPNESGKIRVLIVGEENSYLEKAISILDNVEVTKSREEIDNSDNNNLVNREYDLIVYNSVTPNKLPTNDCGLIIINPISGSKIVDNLSGKVLFKSENVDNLKENSRNEEKNQGIEYKKVAKFEYVDNLQFELAEDIENISMTSDVLETALINKGNSIMLVGEINNKKVMIIGFDLFKSNLMIKPEFPIFINNLIQDFSNNKIISDENIVINKPINLNVNNNAEIIKPNQEKVKVYQNQSTFYNDNEIGLYTIKENNKISYFTVNLDNKPIINKITPENNFNNKIKINKNINWVIILIIIGLMVTEWLVFNYEN